MFNKDLLIKQVGQQFMNTVKASEEKAQVLVNELIEHRENLEEIRKEKEEIIKQLILMDMMKSDLLMKLNKANSDLNQAKIDLKEEEKQLKQQMIHKLYPEVFMKSAFEYESEIDRYNSGNYKEAIEG